MLVSMQYKIVSILSVNMHNFPELLIKRTQFHHQFLVIICAAFRRALSTKDSFFRLKIE